jgi:hypothetical protein
VAANVRKVTLAITNEEYAWAERRAKRAGISVSAVLSAAAKEKRRAEERDEKQRKAWAEIVAYVTNGAPLTSEELAAAERELNGKAPKRRRATARAQAARTARERLDALRALGRPVSGDDGVGLPPRGPRGGLWRPLDHYGLIYEKPAREALRLSRAVFRALVLPTAWVKNPKYSTAPSVGVYDPRTLLAIRAALDSDPDSLAQQRSFVARRRAEIDAGVREEHTAFMQRAREWRAVRQERRRR